jgi:hypothetical protein
VVVGRAVKVQADPQAALVILAQALVYSQVEEMRVP